MHFNEISMEAMKRMKVKYLPNINVNIIDVILCKASNTKFISTL